MKKTVSLALTLALLLAMTACGGNPAPAALSGGGSSEASEGSQTGEPATTLLIAAAASLEYSLEEELIPLFQKEHPDIAVEGSYDSSGKLQSQIEAGLPADLFLSAAEKQMKALAEQKLVDPETVVPLLENRIVLIVPAGKADPVTSFEALPEAGVVAVGDPDSVPAGQYAREALTSLGVWEKLAAEDARHKLSLGTNVTEVLSWVAEGSADAGIVYATDAATTDRVKITAEAPAGSLAAPVIYPAGILSASEKREAAGLFLAFLQSDAAMAVFEKYGFAAVS